MPYSNKILLVDGMALLFRAFYATAVSGYYMINSKGIPTNAVYGFIKHLFTAIEHYQPTHVICCWDMGSKTFRTDLYSEYKANRSAPPEQLLPQFDLVKAVVDQLNIANVGLRDYEADDCIGTLATHYKEQSEVYIITGDQDILQLLDEHVHVVLLKKGYGNYLQYDPESFYTEKGIKPQQMIDLKALMGDSSDNYPGVRGIGEKTGLALLVKYGTIEGILENVHALTAGQRKKIEQDLELLHLSRELAAIYCEVQVSCSLEDALLNIDQEKMVEMFKELEFKNLNVSI